MNLWFNSFTEAKNNIDLWNSNLFKSVTYFRGVKS